MLDSREKNVWVIPTDKPSRLCIDNSCNELNYSEIEGLSSKHITNQHIYITDDSVIREGDWVITPFGDTIQWTKVYTLTTKKIILTTDVELQKNGIQDIPDEFLEWFVKNPSCEVVEVDLVPVNEYGSEITVNGYGFDKFIYKTIIPNKESKQIYYNTVGKENGKFVIKGQFNTQKEALDLANELNKKFPDLYYDWNKTLIKEDLEKEINSTKVTGEKVVEYLNKFKGLSVYNHIALAIELGYRLKEQENEEIK